MITEKENTNEKSLISQTEVNEILKHLNISYSDFDSLDLSAIQLKSGAPLFQLGDPSDYIYLILDGEIDLIKKQSFGKTQSSLVKNQFFGHTEFFLGTERTSIAIAMKDSRLLKLSRENIDYLLKKYPSLMNNIKNSSPDLGSDTIDDFEKYTMNASEIKQEPSGNLNAKQKGNFDKAAGDTVQALKLNMELNSSLEGNTEQLKNQFFQNLNNYLSNIEAEKNRLRISSASYELKIRELQSEIEALKEREKTISAISIEKSEIVVAQTHKIVKLETEAAKFGALEAEHKDQIKTVTDEKEKNKLRIDELKSELLEKTKTISELKASAENHSKEIEKRDKLINEQKAELESTKQKINIFTQEIFLKDKNLEDLRIEYENKNELVSKQNANLNKYKADIERLEIKFGNKEETISRLSAEIIDLKRELNKISSSERKKEEHILGQSAKLSFHQNEIDNYKNELKAKTDKINSLQKRFDDLIEELNEKESQVNQLKKTISEEGNRVSNFDTEKENELNLKIEENLHIKTELETLKNSLSRNKLAIQDREIEINKLKTQLKETQILKHQLSEQETKKSAVEKAYGNLVNENQKIYEKIERLVKEIEEKDRRINQLEELETNLSRERLAVQERDTELMELKAEFEEVQMLQNKLKEQEAKNLSIEKSYDNLIIENQKLFAEFEKLTKEIEEKNNKIEQLQEQNSTIDDLKAIEDKFKRIISEKDRKIEDLKTWYNELELIASENIKEFSDNKAKFEAELGKKTSLISELQANINEIKQELEEKELLESQQTETINNQLQKIAELEVKNDESHPKELVVENANEIEPEINDSSSDNKLDDPFDQPEKDGILSKAELVTSKYFDLNKKDESLEYYKYFDVHIVNVNLFRATMNAVPGFSSILQEIINDDQYKIVLNLSKCEFIDSSIVGVLLNSAKKATKFGGDLRLVGLQPTVHSMMELTGMYRIFSSYSTIEEAITSYEE